MVIGRELTVGQLRDVLRTAPGLEKRQILAVLREQGVSLATTSELNSFLYAHPADFYWTEASASREWHATAAGEVTEPGGDGRLIREIHPLRVAPQLELYPWQRRALRAWQEAGRRGVVEAVTGAGKTRLALQAMRDALAGGQKVAVLVPTLDLLHQWRREIRIHVEGEVGRRLLVGVLGGGDRTSLASCDVLISTAQSAAQFQLLVDDAPALLIADECHHYGAEAWSRGLEAGFSDRLGLTATYEREDLGVEQWLQPYFGSRCYRLGYEEALADGVIAPFRIAFIGVQFTADEASFYDDADAKARKYRQRLVSDWGLPSQPFGEYMRAVQRLRASETPEGSKLAGFYLSAFSKRRQLLAQSRSKLDAISALSPAVNAAERTIVFAQTVAAADAAIDCLAAKGQSGAVIEALMDAEERRDAFTAFERGDYNVVAAPKLLDEGVDVPAADLGIVLATSRSRRQLIQRMGRLIRRKADGRSARIAILFVENTAEDPEQGANEDFLEEVTDVAEAVQVFRTGAERTEILRFLSPRSSSRIPMYNVGDVQNPSAKQPKTRRVGCETWWTSDDRVALWSIVPGCLARHSSCGEGTVVRVEQARPDFIRVLVRFKDGDRWMPLGIGHLEISTGR